MSYQNLFNAIVNVTGFIPLESDMFEIIKAYKKDIAEQNSLIFIAEAYSFDDFWELYDKKVGRSKAEKLYSKISTKDKVKIFEHIILYKQSQPNKKYRKDPETYLRNKAWEDEIIFQPEQQEESKYLNLFNIYKEIQDEYANKPNDGKKFGED
jgi:hypothetical protein